MLLEFKLFKSALLSKSLFLLSPKEYFKEEQELRQELSFSPKWLESRAYEAETKDRLIINKRIREKDIKILFFNTYPPLNEFQLLFF